MGSKLLWFGLGAVAVFLLMAAIGKRLESRGRGGRVLRLVPRDRSVVSDEGPGGCA
jgi:hypothetical protein